MQIIHYNRDAYVPGYVLQVWKVPRYGRARMRSDNGPIYTYRTDRTGANARVEGLLAAPRENLHRLPLLQPLKVMYPGVELLYDRGLAALVQEMPTREKLEEWVQDARKVAKGILWIANADMRKNALGADLYI